MQVSVVFVFHVHKADNTISESAELHSALALVTSLHSHKMLVLLHNDRDIIACYIYIVHHTLILTGIKAFTTAMFAASYLEPVRRQCRDGEARAHMAM